MSITLETVIKTREHFVKIYRDCIIDARSGKVFVNDLDSYIECCEQNITYIMDGKSDHTFTFLQRAHWLQTGECVPFLSN